MRIAFLPSLILNSVLGSSLRMAVYYLPTKRFQLSCTLTCRTTCSPPPYRQNTTTTQLNDLGTQKCLIEGSEVDTIGDHPIVKGPYSDSAERVPNGWVLCGCRQLPEAVDQWVLADGLNPTRRDGCFPFCLMV